jgi:hypothetical protein
MIQPNTEIGLLCSSVTTKSGSQSHNRTVIRLFHIQLKNISYVIRSNPTKLFFTRYSCNDIAKDSNHLIEYKDRNTLFRLSLQVG